MVLFAQCADLDKLKMLQNLTENLTPDNLPSFRYQHGWKTVALARDIMNILSKNIYHYSTTNPSIMIFSGISPGVLKEHIISRRVLHTCASMR